MILVFGGSGFLGNYLMNIIPREEVLGFYHENHKPGMQRIDLLKPNEIWRTLNNYKPNIVIYAAGITNVDKCEVEPDLAFQLNAKVPEEIARFPGVRMIYYSTDYVFDGKKGMYLEDDEPNPVNIYGLSKVAGERAVLAANPSNLIIRVSGLYDSKGIKGERFDQIKSSIIKADDTKLSSPVYVEDVVIATRILLNNGGGGIYHAAGYDTLSRYEFRQLVNLSLEDNITVLPYQNLEELAPRPTNSSLNCKRLNSLGWNQRRVAQVFYPFSESKIKTNNFKNAILIDCVGALLTPRTWLPMESVIKQVNEDCEMVRNEPEFWENVKVATGLTKQELVYHIANHYSLNPCIWNKIRELRKRYYLLLVNNGTSEVFRHWVNKYGLDNIFDMCINSSEIGLSKKEKSFFLETSRIIGIPTNRCLLIDDNKENLDAAKSTGMRTILTHPLDKFPICEHELSKSLDENIFHALQSENRELNMNDRDPDGFMFSQFHMHSTILTKPERYKYFMLSGGTNLFPMSNVLKELISLELSTNSAYGWYTSQEGFPPLQRVVAMYENYAASKGLFPTSKPLGKNVAMTIGGSQAVAAIMEYISMIRPHSEVLVVGFTYPLFIRQANHSGLYVHECLGENFGLSTILPPVEAISEIINNSRPALLVITLPNNPSGESYNENEMEIILKSAVESNTMVLIDKVGQMPIVQDYFVNIGSLIKKTESQLNVIIVNSFSKSDSVPGFRIGYIIANKNIIQYVAKYQLTSIMNPPTSPFLPVFFTLVARSIYLGKEKSWLKGDDISRILSYNRRLFRITTALIPNHLNSMVEEKFSPNGFKTNFDRYCLHQQKVGEAITNNKAYLIHRMGSYIESITKLEAGFNFLVKFVPLRKLDENEFCKNLFYETGVALLTESCFRITKKNNQNFWVRISLASPVDEFICAIDRLYEFISK